MATNIATINMIDDYAVTKPVAARLVGEGYVVVEDAVLEQYRVYRLDPPTFVRRPALCAIVREYALDALDAIAADTSRTGRANAAGRLASALRDNAAGSVAYVRRLTTDIVESLLPEVPYDQARRTLYPYAHPTKAPTAKQNDTAEDKRRYRASAKARARERTASVLAKWLDKHVAPGKYDVAEIWDRWQTEIVERARSRAPELAKLGRYGFYEVLAEVGDVRNGGGHKRYLYVS